MKSPNKKTSFKRHIFDNGDIKRNCLQIIVNYDNATVISKNNKLTVSFGVNVRRNDLTISNTVILSQRFVGRTDKWTIREKNSENIKCLSNSGVLNSHDVKILTILFDTGTYQNKVFELSLSL